MLVKCFIVYKLHTELKEALAGYITLITNLYDECKIRKNIRLRA